MGKIVQNIMDDGGKLAVSSRGMGSLTKKNGANYVNDDFYLATAADIVADPSAPNAFVEGIMEGKSGFGTMDYYKNKKLHESRTKWNVMCVLEKRITKHSLSQNSSKNYNY